MRALGILVAVFLPAAFSQTITPPELGSEFFNRGGAAPLKCEVREIHPVLDFAFRFHAGMNLRVPLNQYHESGHALTVGLRIQPQTGGTPVYMIDHVRLPEGPGHRFSAETESEFMLGEGSYRAAFQVMDDQGRLCRGEWNIEAQLAAPEQQVKLAIAPGTVEPLTTPLVVSPPKNDVPLVDKLTILLHAAPVSPTSTRLHASDAATLMTSLISLLNHVPARSVKLVVFSLDQQNELYRRENFTPDQLPEVDRAISNLQLGVVRYGALQKPNAYLDQLTELVKEETGTEIPGRLVVFLGAHSHLFGRPLTDDAMEKQGRGMPKFFYLEYMRPVALPLVDTSFNENWADASISSPSDMPLPSGNPIVASLVSVEPTSLPANYHPTELDLSHDAIDHMVTSLKGKTLIIRKPCDLARAMQQVLSALHSEPRL